MSNEEPVQDGNTRNEREKATNRNSLPPTRREISFHLSSQLCVWLASLSPPIVSPRGDSFVLDADPEGKMKALVRDPGRGSWRENRCNTRKRFGQFNPLKRMARRREKVGARSRKRPTLVSQPPSSSSSSFLSTLPDSSYVFLSSSSLSLRKGGRVSVFFPNDKTKRERSFFCSTSATPSFLHLDPGSFFETREISLSSNIRVDRFFFQQFEILKRNKYRNWDWI